MMQTGLETLIAILKGYLTRHDRGSVFLLVVIPLLVYLPYLDNPLVFDDLSFFSRAIADYAEAEFSLSLRWLSYAPMGWTWGWVGDDPFFHRLGNVLLHAANGVAVFYLSRRLLLLCLESPTFSSQIATRAAWIGALMFLLHPVAVYAVAYVVQRSILMATLFTLLMWVTYVKGITEGKIRWIVLSNAAFFLAVFSKEHSLPAPLMAVALTVLLKPHLRVPYKWIGAAWLLFSLTGAFVVLRVQGLVGVPYETAYEVLGADSYLTQAGLAGLPSSTLHLLSALTQAGLFFKYLMLWCIPNTEWMSVDMRPTVLTMWKNWSAWVGATFFLVYGGAATWLLFRRGAAGLAGLAMLCPWAMFLVEFSSVRVQEPFVLYRSYLWFAGPVVLVALVIAKASSRHAIGLAFATTLLLFPLAWDRLQSFSTSYRLWNDAALLLDGPRQVGADRIFYNRGNAALSSQKWELAAADFRRVISNNPNLVAAHSNLGAALYGSKQYQAAEAAYRGAIDLDPRNAAAHYGLALTYMRLKKPSKADEHLRLGCETGDAISCILRSMPPAGLEGRSAR